MPVDTSGSGIDSGNLPPAKLRRTEGFEQVEANGDCFYGCVVQAMASSTRGPSLDIQALRNLIADHLTEAHFEALQAAAAVSPREYRNIRRCKTLHDLRALQRVCGNEVGSRTAIWADWPHVSSCLLLLLFSVHTRAYPLHMGGCFKLVQIQLLCDLLNLVVLLRDQAEGFSMVLTPEDGKAVAINGQAELLLLHVIRIGRCHYNLYQVDGVSGFERGALPDTLVEQFSGCHGWDPTWTAKPEEQ